MRTKTVAGTAMVVAAIAGGASVAAAAATGPTSSTGATSGPTTGPTGTTGGSAGTTCDTDAHWPAYVQGAPDGFDAGDNGVFLWHDPKGGWGLRVSSAAAAKTDKVVFTGRITSKGTISVVHKVKDEKNDKVAVVNNGHTLVFRFVDRGGVDGVDFATSCTPGLRSAFRVDKTMMPAGAIHLGDHKVSPGSDPFIIRRRDTDTATTAPKHGTGTAPSAPTGSSPTAPTGQPPASGAGTTPPSGGVA